MFEFRIGSEVRLHSGCETMTVTDISDKGVHCRWIDKNGELCNQTFAPDELVEMETADDEVPSWLKPRRQPTEMYV
jgi:uncharacterized protein YodC (DUF2158 family)